MTTPTLATLRQVLIGLVAGAAWLPAVAQTATPTLTLATPVGPVAVGSTVGVDVLVNGVSNLVAWQFSLAYNPAVLQAAAATEGSFLSNAGSTYFGAGTSLPAVGQLNLVFNTLLGNTSGASGSGVLARVDFTVMGLGTSGLSFGDVVMLDPQLLDITVQAVNGQIQAVPEPSALLLSAGGVAALLLRRRSRPA